MAVAIGLVAIPLLATMLPREVSKWYLAAAAEAALDGRTSDALRNADRALEWSPDAPFVLEHRARLRLRLGDLPGSLEDCNQLILLAAEDEIVDDNDIRPREARTFVFQRLGRHDEAIEDWNFVVDYYRPRPNESAKAPTDRERYAYVLNNRAYARALANKDIEQGLHDIQQSFEARGREDDPVLLDTQGYLYYLNGQYREAKEVMDAAVTFEVIRNTEWRRQLVQQMALKADQRLDQEALRALNEQLSVLYHHRGLVYQKLNQPEKARADLDQARRLGYDPGKGVW
jgi:tetratricopeptide (TPR) repeat protein